MDPSVVFPDEELSKTKKFGLQFRIPQPEDEQSDSDNEPSYRLLRPHSAKDVEGVQHLAPTGLRSRRPWTAHPKSKMPETSARKISRQTLRKPHLRPPARTPSISSDNSSLITAVGLETKKDIALPSDADTGGSKDEFVRAVYESTPDTKDSWATKVSLLSIPLPPHNEQSAKYPSFDSWLEGPPHDSDEYDTDVDIDDFMKKLTIQTRKKRRKQSGKRAIEEEIPLDPTGLAMYDDQCTKQGLVPVSYMQRHLGDKTLRMRHHYLGGFSTKPLAMALKKNTITERVDIGDNYIEAEGALYVAAMLKQNTFITSINISRNFIGAEGFEAFCSMLETNTTLKTIILSGNQLGDRCAQYLVEAVKNNTALTSLDLSNNDFGELGGVYIGNALGMNEGLVELDLSWNAIRNKGAITIINSLTKNNTLEVLDLSWNGCGLPGALTLQNILKINTTLRVLDLSNNRLNTKAAEVLALGLSKNFGLETLVLNLNPMKDAGVLALLNATEKNSSLHFLSLEEIAISASNYNKIRELENNKDIVILHGGVGGFQRRTTAISMVRFFKQFLKKSKSEFEIYCKQLDEDKCGTLVVDEVKQALKQAGLRLTNKQVDIVLTEINFSNHSSINYKNILDGTMLSDYFKRCPKSSVSSSGRSSLAVSGPLKRQLTVV